MASRLIRVQAQGLFDWDGLVELIRAEFAFMEGRIDPPSSVQQLTAKALETAAREGEVWVIGVPPIACALFSRRQDALYIGKLAVTAAQRGRGLARALIDQAEGRALAHGLSWLELETRVELSENQAAFRAMGFAEVGRSAHPGFDRATSITYRRGVGTAG